MKNIAIIGGGYGSLAAAALLARAGHKVTVVEKNCQLGGRAGQLIQDGFRFDTGPSWYLMPEVFDHYYSLFNIDTSTELGLTRLSPGYKVFFETDEPLSIAGNLEKDSETFEQIEPGAKKRLLRYVQKSQKIYNLSVNNILYSNFDSSRWMVQKDILINLGSFIKMALQTLDGYVSKNFKNPQLKKILEYHSVFLGTSPYQAPAIYSLMSTLDFNSGVFFPKKGMYSLVDSLVNLGKKHGVNYLTSTTVEKIIVRGKQATGIQLQNGKLLTADIVISGADLHHTETKLLDSEVQTYPESYWNKKEPSPSALLLSLGITGSLEKLEHHNLYFVDEWRDNFQAIYDRREIPKNASIYICRPSKTDRSAAPKNHENIFILLPLPSDRPLSEAEITQTTDYCLDILEKVSGEKNIKNRIVTQDIVYPQMFADRFNAWNYNSLGGQSHVLRQSAFFRTRNRSQKIKNLYYVGAGTNPGIGLPMCLISAELVFKRIMGIKKNGPLDKQDLVK